VSDERIPDMPFLLRCKAVLRLFRRKSAPVRKRIDYVWKSGLAGLLLVSGFIALSAIWFHWTPSPGKAVAALAVGATVMTFRGELGGLEKFCWTGVLFALLLIEVRAIDKDRAENNAAQREERGILTGMATNIQLSFQAIGAQETYIVAHLPTGLSVKTPSRMPAPRVPPPVVAVGPSYGNLRQQAIDLSQQLYFLLNKEQQQKNSIPPNATNEQILAAINTAVTRMSRDYIIQYHDQVLQVVGDLAKLNFRDRNIDQVLASIDQERKIDPSLLARWVINGSEMSQLASGLTSLASQIPVTQPTLPIR
jgi:hypothetical protein